MQFADLHGFLSMKGRTASLARTNPLASQSSDFEESMTSEASLINAIEGKLPDKLGAYLKRVSNPISFGEKLPEVSLIPSGAANSRNIVLSERDRAHQRENKQSFLKVLRTLDITESAYEKLLANAKAMMIAEISGLIQENRTNITQLDSWLQTHFGRRLKEAVLERRHDQSMLNLVDIDELKSQANHEALFTAFALQ